MKNEETFGLCLSGGGARGASHIGIIKELEKHINITHFCGVSAGAIVAVSYASGNLNKLESRVNKINGRNVNQFFKFAMSIEGLFSSKSIENFVEDIVGDVKLQDLKIPVVVAASDIKHGRLVYFKRGKAAKITAASSAVPGLFTPVKISNMILVDGGLYNNMPSKVLKGKVDHIISVNVGLSGELIRAESRVIKRIEALRELREDLREVKKLIPKNKNKKARNSKRIIDYIKKLRSKFDEDKETRKLVYNSIVSFLSDFVNPNPDFANGTDYLINVHTKVNHLDFGHAKLAITDGRKAARRFLKENNLL